MFLLSLGMRPQAYQFSSPARGTVAQVNFLQSMSFPPMFPPAGLADLRFDYLGNFLEGLLGEREGEL